jgi:predicted deacylase
VIEAVTDRLFGLTDPLPTTGRHMGFVKIPSSTNRSAYGFVPLPIAIVGGIEGPGVLLLAGVYGDEIEAQIAVTNIVRSLDPSAMRGRVIALSMANFPAAQAGTRISPMDGRNLNKSFPGDVFGTPTSIIADYIERHLMPGVDIVIDVHSEGRSLHYLPVATFGEHADPDVQLRRLALARAFGLRNVLRFRSYEDRSTSGAARRAGATRIGAEIGGPGTVGTIADGVSRVLAWAGMVEGPAPASEPRLLLTQRDEDFVYALSDGVFEPAVQLGDRVAAGDLAGHIHDLTRPLSEPTAVRFAAGGIVVCTRGASQAARGDCLMHLATEADREAAAQFDEARALRWLGTQRTRPSGRPPKGKPRS